MNKHKIVEPANYFSSTSRIRTGLFNFGSEDSTRALEEILSPLGVEVFSGDDALDDYGSFELVCLTGKIPNDGRFPEEWTDIIAFQPYTKFSEAKSLLRRVNSVILCRDSERQLTREFFESLLIPSLLNIDLSDVVRMAKGFGLAFHASGVESEEIISNLPKESFLAKSCLLHFSCSEDVTLSEVYRISETLASRKDDRVKIRKVNMKMGLRIQGQSKRIRLTAMLFGI